MITHVEGKEIIETQQALATSGVNKGSGLTTILEGLLEDDSTVWLCAHPNGPDCEYYSFKGAPSVMAHQKLHAKKPDPMPPVPVPVPTGRAVTVKEAAARLQVSESFVYQALGSGALGGEKRGNAWRVPLRAIAEYRKEHSHVRPKAPAPAPRTAVPKATKARTFVEVGVLHGGGLLLQDTANQSMWKAEPL